MNKNWILVFMALSMVLDLAAQQPAPGKWTFHSVDQVGLLQGDEKGAVSLQTVNGFQYRNFFAGLGTGLFINMTNPIPLLP